MVQVVFRFRFILSPNYQPGEESSQQAEKEQKYILNISNFKIKDAIKVAKEEA